MPAPLLHPRAAMSDIPCAERAMLPPEQDNRQHHHQRKGRRLHTAPLGPVEEETNVHRQQNRHQQGPGECGIRRKVLQLSNETLNVFRRF